MKKILIPCDFADTTQSALKYAISLAKYLEADLILLHVDIIPIVSPDMNIMPYAFGDMTNDSLKALKNLADKIRIKESFNHRIDYVSEIGNTAYVIEEQVAKLKADIVVMGISGHGSAFMKNIIGSASVDVSKRVGVPVIIVPPNAVYQKIQNIAYACGYDPEIKMNTSLIQVKSLASVFDAALSIVHVVPENHEMTREESGLEHYIEQNLENSEHKTFTVNENNTGKGLLDFIAQHRIDMMIIEPKKHSFFHKMFSGSTTNEIAFNSPVPVITIHGDL